MNQKFTSSTWFHLFIALFLLPLLGRAQSATVVISQVYGGGGSPNTAATYNQDYVELFNRSTTDQAVGGFTLQYGAATGTSTFSVASALPAGTVIPAGGYYLVALGTGTSGVPTGAALPVAANFTPMSTLNLGATAGRVALVSNSTPLTGTNLASSPTLIDFVGYGSVATYEGSAPVAALSTTSAAFRASDGCTDTNQNSADFAVAAPAPRNASQQKSVCGSAVLVVNPSVLTFSAPVGQVANTATYTLAGYNLAANAAIAINSNNAAVLLSTTGAAGSFARTASVTTTANGTLTQTVTVQFTAPATAGVSNTTISNSDGTRTASVAVTGTAIVAYTWNGSSSNSYSSSANWTPARTTPGSSDVLIFDGAATAAPTVLLDYTSPQTIGQLLFINSVAATLNTSDLRSLLLDNNLPGDDLVIEAGSVVTVANTAAAPVTTAGAGLTISLAASTETAAVSGTLIFAGYTGTNNGRHALQATTPGAIQFLAGSLFRAATTYGSVSPFGSSTGNAGSVIFRNGARYEQSGGSTPFGNSTSVTTTFEPASYFLFNDAGSSPALSGRTYGTLAYDLTGSSTVSAGASAVTIQGDLIVLNGMVAMNFPGGVVLQGNVQVSNGARLSFTPTSANANTIQLSGTTPQTLGGNSTNATPLVFGANATLQINNAAGVTLGMPITVSGTLQLTNGLLTATTAHGLTLANNPTGGSNTSFVNGPVVRPLSAAGAYIFPVGKGAAYRPITLNVSTQSGTTYYRAEQFEGNPGQNIAGSNLTRVSRIRSFTVSPFASAADAASTTAAVTQPSGFSGSITLSYGSGDLVTDPSQLVVAKRPNSGSAWVNLGYGTSSAANGTVTSGDFTSFSDFVLGTTSTDLTTNPLPVVLTQFVATRQASGVVQVSWTTASEQHSAFFEVQRSLDGRAFVTIAKIAASGTTPQAHTYISPDASAPVGQLYYRLHQVDTDGSITFSPVVALATTEDAVTPVLYPTPAHDQLTVAAAAGAQVQILDLVGRVVQNGVLPASNQLRTDALLPGTYLLRLVLNGQQHTLRFTKE